MGLPARIAIIATGAMSILGFIAIRVLENALIFSGDYSGALSPSQILMPVELLAVASAAACGLCLVLLMPGSLRWVGLVGLVAVLWLVLTAFSIIRDPFESFAIQSDSGFTVYSLIGPLVGEAGAGIAVARLVGLIVVPLFGIVLAVRASRTSEGHTQLASRADGA